MKFLPPTGGDTKALYSDVYRVEGHDYGGLGGAVEGETRPEEQLSRVKSYIDAYAADPHAVVVEIGCGLGHLHSCHGNWMGFEYSSTAVSLAKELHGNKLNILDGDARKLPLESNTVDFLFSFAALEHIPEVEKAFSEIERILKPGGIAVIAPAWNCRAWTVKKLEQRPYADLSISEKVGKYLIPLRNNLFFRMACSIPARLARESKLLFGRAPIPLDYKRLEPDFSLWDRFPHISDDDAFVSMDAHAALIYFASRKWQAISHPSFWKRISVRSSEIVVKKPGMR